MTIRRALCEVAILPVMVIALFFMALGFLAELALEATMSRLHGWINK